MVIKIGDDTKLKDPCVGDFAFDFFDFGRIDISDDNFDLVIPCWAHHRLVHTRRVDTVEDRSNEVFCGNSLAAVADGCLIDLIDEVRTAFDIRTEFQLSGSDHDGSGDDSKKDPAEGHSMVWHFQLG